MIEIFEIFWSAKIELRVVIFATLVMGCVWYWQDYKRKQKEKQQERLNQIRIKDNQFEIDANGTETKKDSIL
jgi:predicted aminopeptidase